MDEYQDLCHLTLSCGTVSVRRPRVRGLEERFQSRVLPLLARRVGDGLPELSLHGLSHGDFDRALRGLLGELSAPGGPTEAEGAGRVGGVVIPHPPRTGGSPPLGRRGVRQGRLGEREGRPVGRT